MPLLINPLLHALGERRSTRSLAAKIAPYLQPRTQVIGVEAYAGSLAFYLQRPIVLATDDASELTSNYIVRRYDTFSGREGSTVKPMSWLAQDLERCCETRVYLARRKDPEHHEALRRRGARVIATGAHIIAYAWDGRGH